MHVSTDGLPSYSVTLTADAVKALNDRAGETAQRTCPTVTSAAPGPTCKTTAEADIPYVKTNGTPNTAFFCLILYDVARTTTRTPHAGASYARGTKPTWQQPPLTRI